MNVNKPQKSGIKTKGRTPLWGDPAFCHEGAFLKKRPFNPQKLLLVLELGAWQVRPLRTFCAAYDPAAPHPARQA